MTSESIQRPHTTVVLAMSADGKIADRSRAAARFGSPTDKAHLERQIAQADGVLFGAGTLRSYGTTLTVSQPDLLRWREQQGKPPQPVQIVASRSANLDPHLRFFRQTAPHWLITTTAGAKRWQNQPNFEQIWVAETASHDINWETAFIQLASLGIQRLAVLGGGELVASLLAANLADEFWLTICPLILAGENAPTPAEGMGFSADTAPRLELLSVEPVGDEVFLHYCVRRREAG